MRQQKGEVMAFRTPQHPSLGSNKWGGASPLLARNIPKESLELRYLRLNTIRARDEIFPAQANDFHCLPQTSTQTSKAGGLTSSSSMPNRSLRDLLSKLFMFPRKEKVVSRLNPKKKIRFPDWDPRHRWPQGWC